MSKPLYKVTFLNHGKVYELYARHVGGSSLWGFTEVGELVFDLHEGLVVDPTEEHKKPENWSLSPNKLVAAAVYCSARRRLNWPTPPSDLDRLAGTSVWR